MVHGAGVVPLDVQRLLRASTTLCRPAAAGAAVGESELSRKL